MKNTDFLKESLIANRGIYNNKDVYENTIDSFKLAMNEEYGIHISVHTTKDGKLVVYHDDDLTRLMNLRDRIEEVTYDELSYLCSYHVPTFEETLKLINGQVPIIINPRNQSNKYYLEKEISKQMDNYQGLFAIVSDNASIIKWFNKNKPNYIMGEILSKPNVYSFNLKNFFNHYSIITEFKSVNINYYDVKSIRKLRMHNNIILGFLIDSTEKYINFKDVCESLFVDNVSEIEFI